jgi:hypothetical protein
MQHVFTKIFATGKKFFRRAALRELISQAARRIDSRLLRACARSVE